MIYLTPLDQSKLPQLQELLLRCSDYLEFESGKPVQDDAALELLTVKPESLPAANKHVLGIYESGSAESPGELIGVIDMLYHFPGQGVLNLGLMLFEPAARNKGLGHLAYAALEDWVSDQAIHKVRLGVLFGNEKGLRFWKSVGFAETGEIKPYLAHQFFVLEKNLISSF